MGSLNEGMRWNPLRNIISEEKIKIMLSLQGDVYLMEHQVFICLLDYFVEILRQLVDLRNTNQGKTNFDKYLCTAIYQCSVF